MKSVFTTHNPRALFAGTPPQTQRPAARTACLSVLSVLIVLFLASASIAAEKVVQSWTTSSQNPREITINYVDVELSSIIRILSEMTGKNFIYDESLKGKVTIIAPEKLTTDEALSLFVSAL